MLQSKILLYADDAVLFYADSNIGKISTVLNKDSDKSSTTLQIPWCAKRCKSKQHVDKLLVKISKRIGVLGRIWNSLTVDAANKVYQGK